MSEEKSVKLIQSVQRTIDILNCFTEIDYKLTLNEISERVSLNINTTRGLVNTLVYNGLLAHNSRDNSYGLGLYFLTKHNILQKQVENYIASAKPLVDAMVEKFHISASLQLVNQRKIYSIYCSYPTNSAYTIVLTEYDALPLHATSSGKLLCLYNMNALENQDLSYLKFNSYTENTITDPTAYLKHLQEIKKNGYATECEEFAWGVGSMAVPVLDKIGKLVATASATFFAGNFPYIEKELLADLQHIAAVITRKISSSGLIVE